jgi:hypothetical protein
MAFMEKQITSKCEWYQIETSQGTWFVDRANVSESPDTEEMREELGQFCEGVPVSWETITGYGCRLSAPGYLDCTEWAVFPSLAECDAYLNENYPEDEETGE